MTQQPARICILGGGFGVSTRHCVSQLPWEKSERPELSWSSKAIAYSPLLYELPQANCKLGNCPAFEEILYNTGVRFCVVTGIDIDQRRVQLQDGPEISYDQLVLALVAKRPWIWCLGDILCSSVPHDQGCLSLGRTAASFGRICCRQTE